MNKFFRFIDKMPPVNTMLELIDFSGKSLKDTLIKVEFVNNEVVYSWAKSKNKMFNSWRLA